MGKALQLVLLLVVALVCSGSGFAGGSSDSPAEALVELTQANFHEHLRTRGPLLVQFCADWHKACQQFEPAWRSLAQELAGSLTVGRVDFNDERELTEHFGVTTLPTFKFIYGDGIAVDYQGDLDATQLAEYGLALLSPQMLTLSTQTDLSRESIPHSVFILFHVPHDSSAVEAFVAGIRPFVEAGGVLFARSHSLEFARSLFHRGQRAADQRSGSGELPLMPFVAVVKDWDLSETAVAVRPVTGSDDTKGLVAFLQEHWMPIVPKLEAASFRLQELQQHPDFIGLVVAVGPHRDAPQTSEFLNAVRQVALEYREQQGASPKLAFSWVEGPHYQQWLSEFAVDESQFGSHVFVLDSLRKSFYPGVSVHSAGDLRGYLQRVQSGSVKAQKMVQHKRTKAKELDVLAVLEEWVRLLELPDWWKPSHWAAAASAASPNAIMYLSLIIGLVFSLVLLRINRSATITNTPTATTTTRGSDAKAAANGAGVHRRKGRQATREDH